MIFMGLAIRQGLVFLTEHFPDDQFFGDILQYQFHVMVKIIDS